MGGSRRPPWPSAPWCIPRPLDAVAAKSLCRISPGYAGQDLMRVTGSCSEVALEVSLNIAKGFLEPLVTCCSGRDLEALLH